MIKLTGGKYKGRSLKTSSSLNTRPTSAKVREALFNIIDSDLSGKIWLDLFAGSGAVGIEAYSRNAEKVTFIEKDYSALQIIKKNISLVNAENSAKLIKADACNYILKTSDKFDYIFLDPPYIPIHYEKAFINLNRKSILNDQGILIVEHNSKYQLPDLSLTRLKSYKYGDSSLTVYRNEEQN